MVITLAHHAALHPFERFIENLANWSLTFLAVIAVPRFAVTASPSMINIEGPEASRAPWRVVIGTPFAAHPST